ncbi:MAG TPA: TIGR00730 family Rossman fold protein [Burkholderiaceae bacterium]|nr:TIGR00730 family Rossman fold protein [Burkholderiaceae bacterium]
MSLLLSREPASATARRLSSIAIYCGASPGQDPRYLAAARAVGAGLAERGIVVVYGGGRVGMMGALADAALAAGGRVVGVIPQRLMEREAAHRELSELHVVPDMHTRKARMAALAEGFIALPGGIGTYDELFEILTWLQLGYHRLPVGVLNVAGYFDPLLALLDRTVSEGFLSPATRAMLLADLQLPALLAQMERFLPEDAEAWLAAKLRQEP